MRLIGLAVILAVSSLLRRSPPRRDWHRGLSPGILTAGRALPFEEELHKLGYRNVVIVRR